MLHFMLVIGSDIYRTRGKTDFPIWPLATPSRRRQSRIAAISDLGFRLGWGLLLGDVADEPMQGHLTHIAMAGDGTLIVLFGRQGADEARAGRPIGKMPTAAPRRLTGLVE
jgi:hypothetical protein